MNLFILLFYVSNNFNRENIDNSTEENEQNGKRAIEFAKRIKWMKKY